jgi:hypothetical protein
VLLSGALSRLAIPVGYADLNLLGILSGISFLK